MRLETETFYVVANIGGGYMRPTFVKYLGTGFTDAWGRLINADRFESRKDATAFIRKYLPDNKHQYTPMRVRIDMKLYN